MNNMRIKTIFEKEARWFGSLRPGQKARVLYAGLSMCLLLGGTSPDLWIELGVAGNAFVALWLLNGINTDELDE